jgi:6-pyruvoyltetrahydropterin/6-carboxytetrahydropterin synthase
VGAGGQWAEATSKPAPEQTSSAGLEWRVTVARGDIRRGRSLGSGIMTERQHPQLLGRFTISRDFEFSASHELRQLPGTHKCSGNHGHNYVVTLTVTADRLDEYGFVTDFADLAPFGDYLTSVFDHRLINDQVDFHPTSELLAYHVGRWFIGNVEPRIHGRLVSVRVAETRLSSAVWERPEAW